MKHNSNQTSVCPIARSLDIVGERWSLLILRDAMLGVKRFSEFQRRLGMAKNILSVRLKNLVEVEVLRSVPASDGSAYQEYELTEKGKALLPTLVALRQWGEEFVFNPKEQYSLLVDRKKRKPLAKIEVRSADNRPLTTDDLDIILPDEPKRRRTVTPR
jgi:DNA-binding HxlR family transcriptional regulator